MNKQTIFGFLNLLLKSIKQIIIIKKIVFLYVFIKILFFRKHGSVIYFFSAKEMQRNEILNSFPVLHNMLFIMNRAFDILVEIKIRFCEICQGFTGKNDMLFFF